MVFVLVVIESLLNYWIRKRFMMVNLYLNIYVLFFERGDEKKREFSKV